MISNAGLHHAENGGETICENKAKIFILPPRCSQLPIRRSMLCFRRVKGNVTAIILLEFTH